MLECLLLHSEWDSKDAPSAENGIRNIAQNAEYQYGHAGLISAMSRGAAEAMTAVTTTR